MAPAVAFILVTAFVLVMLLHLKRTFFYPRPRSMSSVVEVQVETALSRFEDALRVHAPEILAALQPGLSNDQIRELESRYRIRLSEDLRALYRWRNGSLAEPRVNLIPMHWFAPLEYALQQRAAAGQQSSEQTWDQWAFVWLFAGHRIKWLCVLDDTCGDGYFYDPSYRRRLGSFFYSFSEDRQYRFFPTLAHFLVGASECYERRVYRVNGRGEPVEDFDRSFELWPQYAAM